MRLLDLFCGAGGAAVGYYQAGFSDIVGVDIVPQPDYPFTFIQGDALEAVGEKRATWLASFDLIHASPPCQDYSSMSNRWGSQQPRLIDTIRELIVSRPYVIENVVGARSEMVDPLLLTGGMFGLAVHRPRLFELGGWFAMSPPPARRQADSVAVYGKPDGRLLWTRSDGTQYHAWSSVREGQEALGIGWTDDWHQLREAIPPAYTKFIGEQFLEQRRAA